MVTLRQEKVIKILIQTDRPLFGEELVHNFLVTTRTLRSDISSINDIFKSYGVQIQSNPSVGYWIEEIDKCIFEEHISYLPTMTNIQNMIPSISNEREIFIYFKLLMETDYITMDTLADMLYVSKTTVSKDIKHMYLLIESIKEIKLVISSVKGIHIEGEEEAKRRLFSAVLLYYYENNFNFLKIALMIFGLNNKNELVQVYNSLMDYLNHQEIILTDKSLIILSMEILIGAQRKKLGFELKYNCLAIADVELPFKEIENIFQVDLNEIDKNEFLKAFSYKRVISSYISKSNSTTLAKKVMKLYFNTVMEQFKIDLSLEDELKDHINAMLLHIQPDSNYSEFLINDIKINYQFAFEIASMLNPIVKQMLNVELVENELAAIAARLVIVLDRKTEKKNTAIICGCGLSYAQLLRFKLENHFSNKLNIIGIYPLYQIDKLVESYTEVDLIISTMAFRINCPIDMIQISDTLSQEDIIRINNYFQQNSFSSQGL